MMKTKIFKTAKALLICLAVLFSADCSNVGLGDAVDTAVPTVEISYPPKNAIVRDTFVASGICDDDIIVASVEVTLTNTTTKKEYGPYTATLDLERKAWTIQLNQKNGGKKTAPDYDAFEAYKQWEFPDGSYIVSAVAYDQKKKASQEASVPVDIDNTAPVLLVSKPLATGSEKASVYGRTINITGDVSEEHESTKLTLYYKEFDKTKNEFVDQEPKTLEINGFGTMSSDSPLTIAKYNKALDETTEDVLHNNYLKIYNETVDLTQSNEKLYYCGFMLEDNAKVYQNPGDTGLEGGNKTDQYYILSDSYNEELFSENTYSLNARNLMLLLSGKSSYTQEQISDITALLKKTGNSASSSTITATESTKFSVDPKNNPVWSISNFELWNGDFATFETGSAVPLNLEAGGDAIAVDKSSIQIELYHLGTKPVEITAQTPHATLIKKGNYADGILKEALSPQNEKSINFYKDDDPDTVVSVGLNVNHYYEIIVNGSDISGNELESKQNNRYGFKRLSSFAPPSFTFNAAQGAFAPNEYQRGSTVNEGGIIINGTIVTADKDIFVQKENVQITGLAITDISDSNKTVSTADVNNSDSDNVAAAQVQYTYEIKDFELVEDGNENKGKAYNFTAVIKNALNARLTPQEEGAYKYKITFVAEDSLSAQNDGTDFEFKLDSKAPELSDEIVISPVVSKDDKTYVNGTISITGNISDTGSGFKKLSYAIGNAAATQIENPGFHWTFNFDTTALEDNKAYVLNIYAEDTVGNLLTIPCNILVDQSTDYPQVSFTNKDTVFSKTSNVLVGNIKDDDGLDTVTVKYKKTSPVPDAEYTNLTLGSFTKGTTSYSLNVNLPQEEGEYELVIFAKDIKGLATGSKTESVTVTKDNGEPEFSIKTPNTSAATYYNKDITITGTVKEGSGVVTISRDVYKVSGETESKIDSLCVANLSSAITGTAAQITEGTTWTDTFVKPQEGGTYKLVYTAKDKLGTASEQTITFSIDIENPSIEKVEFENQDISTIEKWFHTNYGEFTVTTDDPTSAVVNVRCTKDNPEGTNPNWINMSAKEQANQWTSTITFEAAGEQKLYIKAIDKAGNESEVKEVHLKVDTVLPVLEVTAGPEGNIYVNKTVNKSFTVTYYDEASGIEKDETTGKPNLIFCIGSTDISNKIECSQKTDAQGNLINEYDITIPKDEFVSGLFKIIGTDVAGNKTEVDRCTFVLDEKAPEIKNISISQTKDDVTNQAYKKSDSEYFIKREAGGEFTISGIATDDNVLKSVALSITDGTHTYAPASSDASSWSFANIDFTGWTDATITLTAKDEATDAEGNSAAKTIQLKFDESAPGIITGECPDNRYTFRGQPVIKYNNLNLGEGRYSVSSYGRMTSITVTTYVDDKEGNEERSGLARLEYKLYTVDASANIANDTLQKYFNGTQALDANTTLASSGTFAPEPDSSYEYYNSNLDVNGIAIGTVTGTATKATANISGFNTTASEKVNYLLLRPVDNCGNIGLITILKIHVDQTAPVIETISTEQLTNGTKPINLSGSVSDEDSGLKALRVIINGVSVLEINNKPKDSDGNSLVDVNGEPERTFSNDYGTISYTSDYLFRDAPSSANWTVQLTPGQGDWFTKLGDNAEIYIEAEDWAEHEGKGNIAPNPTKAAVLKIDTKAPKLESISPANNTKLNGTNTISGTTSDEGSSPEEISIYYSTAADMPAQLSGYTKLQTLSTTGENAVNVSELYNFNFDVNFDNLIAADKEIQDIWILALVTDMAGNQSALSPVLYKIDRNTDRPNVKIVTDGINLSIMSEDKPVLLKEKQVYVNITDDDGNVKKAEFRTKKAGQTLGENDGWENNEIELRNGSGKFALEDDGKQTVEFRITDANNKVFTSFATNNWERVYVEDIYNHLLGKEEASKPEIYTLLDVSSPRVELKGIKLSTDADASEWRAPSTFKTILGGATENIKLKVQATDAGTGVNKVSVVVKLNENEVANSPFTATLSNEKDVYTAEIPCSSGDGIFEIEIKALDGAGREGSEKKQFEIDNTKPVLTVDSPDVNTEHSGTVKAIGYSNEVVNLSYAVTKKGLTPESYKNYTNVQDFTTTLFNICFEGESNTEPNYTKKLNDWIVSLGITTQAEIESTNPYEWYAEITQLDLHLKAVDIAGNEENLVYPIHVDPQGDRPKVEFSYPRKDVDNITLGGTINIIGSVTGKAQSYTVYMQIDANGDGEWNAADKSVLEGKGYSLPEIPVLSTQTNKHYGIEIPVDGDVWSQKINESNELDGTIKVRLYALDNNNLISSPKIKTITIDKDIPVIDQNIKLVQWSQNYDGKKGIEVTASDENAGKYSFKTGAVKAIRDFTDGMSVSGKWYVIGKVYDASGISKINFDGSKDDGASLADNTLNADGSIVIPYTDSVTEKKNYIFCFPVGSGTEEEVGKTTVAFYAKDGGSETTAKAIDKPFNVIYDNKKPRVTTLEENPELKKDQDGKLEILNENGFYTFKSTSFEDSVGSVNQTGIERIVFFFTRDIPDTDQAKVIIDPMIRNGAAGNKQSYASGFDIEDNLYWKKATVSSVSNNKLTLSAAPSENIHVGGLAKVNGIIYKITKIEGSVISLSGNPGSVSTAKFAIANVIDNIIPEDVPINNENLKLDSQTNYGYGYLDPVKVAAGTVYDDGDLMPERCNNVGTQTTWQASINSKNIGDGPVTLHYLVFDKAGNYTYNSSSAMVQNNSPRIAGAFIGTDEDGNGTVDTTEFVSYHEKFIKGYDVSGKKATNITFPLDSTDTNPVSVITIKRDLVIKPEIVGGNGTVGYTYKVAKRNTANDGWAAAYYNSSTTPDTLGQGTAEDDESFVQTTNNKEPEIKIFVKDLLDNLKETNVYAGDADNQKFSFTVWDSTPGLTPGTNSQSAVMNVIMNVALLDTTSAKNKIIPFYWKSSSVNSLKDNSSDLGHIELSADLAHATNVNSTNPKISGAVKLEGIAQDNSLLEELSVAITGFKNAEEAVAGASFTIASYSAGEWTKYSGTGWSTEIKHATYGEYRDAGYVLPKDAQGNTIVQEDDYELPYASQEYGHVVHWIMTLDTEAMGITPKAGIGITVSAKDKGKPSLNGASVIHSSNASGTDEYTIDVVPYIRGIKTKLSTKSKKADSSEYDRTALGHYPVASTETLYLYGFNLAEGNKLYDKAGNTATLGAAIKETDSPKPEVFTKYESYKGFTLYPVAGISSFKTGPVYVKSGAAGAEVESLNNKNWNNAQGSYGAEVPGLADAGLPATRTTFSNFYNRKPNQQNNYMLTDDVILDVWNLNSQAAKPAASGAIFDPVMKINPSTGIIGFAYVSGTRRFSMANNNNSYQLWVGDYDNLSGTGFAYDSAGNTYGTALGGDINSDFSNSKYAFMASLWGPSDTSNVGTKSDSKHQRIEQIGQIGTKTTTTTSYIDKNRVQSPSIAVSGSGESATVYLAYYDHLNQEIRFRWAANPIEGFKKKINNKDKRGFSGTSYINDRYTQKNLGSNGNGSNDKDLDNYNTTDFQIIAESGITNTTSLGEAGPYVSIDVIPANTTGNSNAYDIVVLAWYDKENKNLMYTFNKTNLSAVTQANFEGSANTKTHWETAKEIFTDAGMYCQIKVAADGSIHFAGYDGDSGDVCYAKLETYDDTSVESCIVDSNGIVGSNLTLDVALDDAGVAIPYIGYYGSSGPKMAYLSDLGKAEASVVPGAITDMFTGYWEVTEIPTESNAVKDRVNVGVWKWLDAVETGENKHLKGQIKDSTTGTNAHAGSGNTSDDGSVYGNGTAYPVVGYEIRPSTDTGFMETAQKQ